MRRSAHKLVHVEEAKEPNSVAPADSLVGKTVLSLASGNKLGHVTGVNIDPVNGLLVALALKLEDGEAAKVPYEAIHSFGRDAVMAESEQAVLPLPAEDRTVERNARDLFGTKVILESGVLLGEIANVLVTLRPPPSVLYEVRRSMLDRLLGRTFFIPASVAYVLSDDAERLLVPDITSEIATTEVNDIAGPAVDVRSFPASGIAAETEDETLVREPDEDATVLRRHGRNNEDDTLIMP